MIECNMVLSDAGNIWYEGGGLYGLTIDGYKIHLTIAGR